MAFRSFSVASRPSSSLREATTVVRPCSARMRATSQPMPLLAAAKVAKRQPGTPVCKQKVQAAAPKKHTASDNCDSFAARGAQHGCRYSTLALALLVAGSEEAARSVQKSVAALLAPACLCF